MDKEKKRENAPSSDWAFVEMRWNPDVTSRVSDPAWGIVRKEMGWL